MVECVILALYSLFYVGSIIGVGLILGFVAGLGYAPLYYDRSENTGNRRWKGLIRGLTRLTYPVRRHYFDYTIEYRGEGERQSAKELEKEVTLLLKKPTKEQRERGEEREAAIFAASPHGLLAISTLFHSVLTDKYEEWSRLTTCVHRHMFFFPVVRELALWLGLVDVTHNNMVSLLEQGRSLYLAPGGCREMIIDKEHPVQTRHSGFLSIAYEQGVPVYPVIHIGQDEVFRSWTWPALDSFRTICLDLTGYPFPTFFTPPLPKKLSTYVFPAFRPTTYDTEEAFIAAYWKAVVKHYEALKVERQQAQEKRLSEEKKIYASVGC
jgi:hypothetical protein